MFTPIAAFSGISTNDINAAKTFYHEVLGFETEDRTGGFAVLLPNGNQLWIYNKLDHQPAVYTTFNFIVENIDEAVDALVQKGVAFEHYEGSYQDDKEIMRGKEHNMGPNIAWLKDPAGNILAVLEN